MQIALLTLENQSTGTDKIVKIVHDVIYSPIPPDKPNPKVPPTKTNPERFYNKEVIGDLQLQHVPSNRRMKDFDDREYGYQNGGPANIYFQPAKKEDIS